MRIPIREQLTLIILLTSFICLGVASLATWFTERQFVVTMRSARLSLTASLKAAQLASNLDLMQTTASFVSSRVLLQALLRQYADTGTTTSTSWNSARDDLQTAIGGDGSVGASLSLQARIFPADPTGARGAVPLINVTGSTQYNITLPYKCPNGSPAMLGDQACQGVGDWGYPAALYPNLTYTRDAASPTALNNAIFEGKPLPPGSTLVLGPVQINETFSLVSLTVPIINNTSATDVLGFLTVVMDAHLILDVVSSTAGLTETGQTLLIGPASRTNTFQSPTPVNASVASDFTVRYITPVNVSDSARSHGHDIPSTGNRTFKASQFPIVATALALRGQNLDPSGSSLNTRNEAQQQVSVGYALPPTNLVDWVILIEMARSEVMEPVRHLRNVLLACGFGTAGFMLLLAFPLAHLFSLPIRRLRAATSRSVEPPTRKPRDSFDIYEHDVDDDDETAVATTPPAHPEKGQMSEKSRVGSFLRFRRKVFPSLESESEGERRQTFRIPGRVKVRKHWIKDELSDLTGTFNEMSDELMMQYTRLEERVRQRTAELELSKKAAESANESKTLFIANISHELKTPLNGILGMCAVCMQEDDPLRLKRSLGIIYKSGDLLLNLLTDLLTFSKNQVGQQLSLDEKEFRLRDISSQVLAIFEQQARSGKIDLSVKWGNVSSIATSPPHEQSHSGQALEADPKIEDMIIWGDMHRILQVVINLVSNSLKFTPPGGRVTLIVRCFADDYASTQSKPTSLHSRTSQKSKHASVRVKAVDSDLSLAMTDSVTGVTPSKEQSNMVYLRSSMDSKRASPPGRNMWFEFEVEDTGPGIPEHQQQQIFEPFMQGDLGLSKRYGGTGLGLSICSQLASLMKGAIHVQSTVGQGSIFTMRIPLRLVTTASESTATSLMLDGEHDDAARQGSRVGVSGPPVRRHSLDDSVPGTQPPLLTRADSQPRLVGLSQPFFAASQSSSRVDPEPDAMHKIADAVSQGHKIRVLVAEDNKVNQEVVLRMLKLEDIYDVTVANDGQEALDLIKASMDAGSDAQPYNLIFMDVQMPRVDGLTSTRLIREIGYNAPIVALTALSEESNVNACMNAGMNYFLSKPIRRPQLRKVLKQYCTPILEENEEATTPPAGEEARTKKSAALDAANTTVVVIDGSQSGHATEGVTQST